MKLKPVDFDPFSDGEVKTGRLKLTPVDENPFVEPEDPGFGQAALIGAGRQIDRLGKGIKQMGLNVASAFGSDSAKQELGRMAEQEAENTRIYEGLQQVRPGATILGEVTPLLATPVMGAGALGMAASAALPGLVEYGTPEERLERAGMGAAGGAAGYGLAKLFTRAVKPTADLSESQRKALEAAERLKVNLTAGEASGNKALKWAESASADVPFASGIASKRAAANDKAIAQAATRALGQQADEVTEGALASARSRLSNTFNSILKPLKIDLAHPEVDAKLKSVVSSDVLSSLRDESVDKVLREIEGLAQRGSVSGKWFQQNKTALDKAIRASYLNGRPGEAAALEGIEEALDLAAQRAMGKNTAQAYELARQQWAALRMLETGKIVEDGRVLSGRLKSAMEKRYGAAMKEGKITGELADIARLSGVLRPPPQSGTVPRALYTGVGLAGAVATPAATATAFGVPTAIQAAAGSSALRNYMTNGLLALTPEMEALIRSGGARAGLLGVYGANQ